jgi:hypothetical protein
MKRALRSVHKYLSLTMAAMWLLQAATGVLLVFHWELDDWAVSDGQGADPTAAPTTCPRECDFHRIGVGAEVPREDLIWQDPLPRADYVLIDSKDVSALKSKIIASGSSGPELVRTAWAAAATFWSAGCGPSMPMPDNRGTASSPIDPGS